MINRKIGFDVVYQVGKEQFERDRVQELKFSLGSGYDLAITKSGREVQMQPLYAFLLQFTGEFDKDGQPVHDHDILATDDGTLLVVMFYAGAYWLHIPGKEEGTLLDNQSCRELKIVGDAIRNSVMLVPDDAEEKLLASTERRILPFVNLPLAG